MAGTHPNPEDICVGIVGFAYEGEGAEVLRPLGREKESSKGREGPVSNKERH
jgi:hypothetical protein